MEIILAYRHLFTKHRGDYLRGLPALLASNALLLTIPWLIKYAIDSLDQGVNPQLLLGYALGIAGVAVLQAVIRVQSRRYLLGISRKIEYDVKGELLAHLQRLAPSYYQRVFTGDLMSRAAHDVLLVRALGGPGVMYLANSLFIYSIALPMMVAIDPLLTALVFLPFPIVAYLIRGVVNDLKSFSQLAQETLGRMNTVVQETLNGIVVVKAFRMESRQEDRFEGLNRELMDRNLGQARARARLMPLITATGGVGALGILFVGGMMTIRGGITYGDFAAFYAYLGMLLRPTVALGWILSLIQRAKAGLERLDEVFSAEVTIPEPREPIPVRTVRGEIEIRELIFSYAGNGAPPPGDGQYALQGISLAVNPGELLVLVGRVGSGKSTLLKAILRLLEVPPDRVFLDGHDITRLPVGTLRRAIGYVPQDDFLFSSSIAENIGFGRPAASSEAIEQAARLAAIHEEILAFPDGYETHVGERGLTLAGGQRQRIALARALLTEPRVLILDNALAHVDAETEGEILTALREYWSGRTVLMATNRLTSLNLADRVAVLDEGRMVAVGDHQSLLEESEVYRVMWEQHRLSMELAEL